MIKTELKRTTTEIYNDYVFCFILFIIFSIQKGQSEVVKRRSCKISPHEKGLKNIATWKGTQK